MQPHKAILFKKVTDPRSAKFHHRGSGRKHFADVVDYLAYIGACLAQYAHEHEPVVIVKVVKLVHGADTGDPLDRGALRRPLVNVANELLHDAPDPVWRDVRVETSKREILFWAEQQHRKSLGALA